VSARDAVDHLRVSSKAVLLSVLAGRKLNHVYHETVGRFEGKECLGQAIVVWFYVPSWKLLAGTDGQNELT
jgi:hypothetical protein